MPEPKLLLFEKWDVRGIKVEDAGLQRAISLKPSIAVTSMGRHEHKKFGKLEVNIVERVANNIMHFGKKNAKNAGRMGGKKQRALKIVASTLDIIALKTGQNPIEVVVRAVENSSPERRHDAYCLRRRRLPRCGGHCSQSQGGSGAALHFRGFAGSCLFQLQKRGRNSRRRNHNGGKE